MLLGSFIPSYGSLFQIIQWNLQTQEVVSYTSSEMIPIKYELIKSTWYRMISLFTTHDNNRLIAYNFATCANVSAKSISSCWLFPCTTSLALIFTISFCLLSLFLKTHFMTMTLLPFDLGTISQTSFHFDNCALQNSTSLFMTSDHNK